MTEEQRLAQMRSGMDAVAQVAREALASSVRTKDSTLAEISHIAALAAERLEQPSPADLDAIRAMLREIQNAGHLAYLKAHGAEADYQAIGAKVAKRYRTPGGKWRK